MRYRKGLLPGEEKSKLFRHIWLNALPESIHEAVAADDGDLEGIEVKATKRMREKRARPSRAAQVNAVRGTGDDLPEQCGVDAVSAGRPSKGKKGYICDKPPPFPGQLLQMF